MNNLFKAILLAALVFFSADLVWAAPNAERNYFQFVVPEYHTTRQSGQTVSLYVRYAYRQNLSTNEYPDYRILRTKILKYMEPSDELPENVFWEILATKMGQELMAEFPLAGVSIHLNVLDNPNPGSYEPGDHGPTYTIGDVAPWNIH